MVVKPLLTALVRDVRKGLRRFLISVGLVLRIAGANIANVELERAEGERAINMLFTVEVTDRDHLARVLRALRGIPETLRIQRIRP